MNFIKLRHIILIIIILSTIFEVKSSQNPIIYGEDEIEIDERIPIIKLNWTVNDDNPWRYEIWQDTNLLKNDTFDDLPNNSNYSIEFEFGLGQGTFHFILWVWDYNNQSSFHETVVHHGEPPKTILAFSIPFILIITLISTYYFLVRCQSKSNH